MSHEIFGDRFLGRDKPAWHGLGNVFTEPIGAIEAFKTAGLDYEVTKLPLVAMYENADESVGVLGTKLYLPARQALPDDNTENPYVALGNGAVTEEFTHVQNMDLAAMIEPFTEEWPVETVAALKGGSITFITLNVGEFEIAGETNQHYLAVNNGHDGGRALSIDQCDIRRVCWNTMTYGEARAEIRIKLRHTQGVMQEAEWYTEQILAIRGGIKRQEEKLQRMAEVKMNSDAFKKYTKAVFPDPKRPKTSKSKFLNAAQDVASEEVIAKIKEASEDEEARFEQQMAWVHELRDASTERWAVIDGKIAGTVYGGYQAVNEVTNWRRGANAEESLVIPGGARQTELNRAFDQALALV